MKSPRLLAIFPLLVLGVSASVANAAAPQEPIKFMMNPHVHGDLVTFSYQGDLWIVERDGTGARRLTNHLARDVYPRFSPDGRSIAFSSNRFGNYDVFLVSLEGGEPTQLTFHDADDTVEGWTRDGRIMFATRRGVMSRFYTPLYTVSPEGDLPLPMEMDRAGNAAESTDGRYLVFNQSSLTTPRAVARKGQRGNRTNDIWILDRPTGDFTKLTDPVDNPETESFREHVHDAVPMWGADDMIYFVSERDGFFNIWRMAPDGTGVTQVTRHTQGGVKYPSISNDGSTIVYTNDHALYVLDVPGGSPQQVSVELSFDPSINQVEWADVEDEAQGFAAHPEGHEVAVDSRGEIFVVPADPEEGEKRQITSSAWRDRYQKYSPDGRYLAFVSDEGAEEQIWVMELATGDRRKLTDHDSYKTSDYVWSPDSERIAFVAANRLFEVDVASGRTSELAYNENRGFSLSEYSPDGRWLVYARSDLDEDSEVYLFEVESRREINVTQDPFRDYDGVLTPDGKHIVFRSGRDAGTAHLFVASLTALSEDPDDPLVRGRDAGDEDEGEGRRGGSEEEDAPPPPVQVDPDGIRERAKQLTSGENGAGSYFLSADGDTVYFTSRDDEGAGLFSIPIDGGESRQVASGSFGDIQPTQDRRTIFFSRGQGEVHHMSLSNARPEQVEFSFSVKVDHRAEWEQIFEEAWRVMKFRFSDPDMHGRDWDAIKAHYKPLLAHVGSYEDVQDLANQMIGELNASHVGVSRLSSVDMESEYDTRLPGVELEPAQGRYRISHVYRDGPADKEWLDMEVGDFVLGIDGQEIRPPENYWRILNHALNEYVTLRVADSPDGANGRDQRIKTVDSRTLRNIRYLEWVEKNREFVERESEGKIAYVHIEGMNQPSLRIFENEINRFWNAQGIIVDIRYNGGGNTDQQILDILERRPYEYWNNRWAAPSSGRRPRQAIAGPKVMLINAGSGSDSEVTPLGFRDLGLGSIVGNPTAAAVIATGSYGLMNGGSIRTPGSLVVNYDPTKPHNHGINLENYGVAPDVYVWNTPEDELAGFDRELKAAVDEALRMLAAGLYKYQGGGG
jgi:tricorn protease